jgi:glucose-1-phosphate thymidylyltransferase
MIGIIPAAGKGSRLSFPFSKELLPLLDRGSFYPIIQSSIDAMRKVGIKKIIIIVNYQKSDLLKFLGNGSRFDLQIVYVVQEEPTSLPQALLEAVKITGDEEVLFLMPDTIILPNDFLTVFCNKINPLFPINIGCFKTSTPEKYAMISEENSIVDFIEEKNPNSILKWMWGFWYWNKEFSSFLRNYIFQSIYDSEITLSEVADSFLREKKIYSVKLHDYRYRDLGTFDEIIEYMDFMHAVK